MGRKNEFVKHVERLESLFERAKDDMRLRREQKALRIQRAPRVLPILD